MMDNTQESAKLTAQELVTGLGLILKEQRQNLFQRDEIVLQEAAKWIEQHSADAKVAAWAIFASGRFQSAYSMKGDCEKEFRIGKRIYLDENRQIVPLYLHPPQDALLRQVREALDNTVNGNIFAHDRRFANAIAKSKEAIAAIDEQLGETK